MKNFGVKSCRGNQNTRFRFNNVLFRNSWRRDIMWKNTVGPGRPQVTLRRMRIEWWTPKATNTHSEYTIIFFRLQQWLHERTSVLRYTCIACLLCLHLIVTWPRQHFVPKTMYVRPLWQTFCLLSNLIVAQWTYCRILINANICHYIRLI
jgi:hypothetical protein